MMHIIIKLSAVEHGQQMMHSLDSAHFFHPEARDGGIQLPQPIFFSSPGRRIGMQPAAIPHRRVRRCEVSFWKLRALSKVRPIVSFDHRTFRASTATSRLVPLQP
jgi:hypothetical protein